MTITHYELLGVSRDVAHNQLKKRYKELVLKHHPDKNNGIESELFIQINEAWKILSDAEARKKYDAQIFGKEKDKLFINEDVPFEELKYDHDDDVYVHECRCGGEYITESCNKAEAKDCVIQCSSCTLFIKIC